MVLARTCVCTHVCSVQERVRARKPVPPPPQVWPAGGLQELTLVPQECGPLAAAAAAVMAARGAGGTAGAQGGPAAGGSAPAGPGPGDGAGGIGAVCSGPGRLARGARHALQQASIIGACVACAPVGVPVRACAPSPNPSCMHICVSASSLPMEACPARRPCPLALALPTGARPSVLDAPRLWAGGWATA